MPTVRRLSNCLIFAAVLWFRSRGRTWIAVRRSEGLKGLVPHFLHLEEHGDTLIVRDYFPRRRKLRFGDQGDFALLFDGEERRRVYRLETSRPVDQNVGHITQINPKK